MANAPYYEEGLHFGQITRQGITKASTGNMQVVWGVKVLGVPEGEASFAPHNQQYERTIYWTITEKTMSFIVEKLQALEFSGSKFSQLDPNNPYHVSLVGQQVELWCKHEQGQNGVREKWDFSNGGPKPMEALTTAEARQLDALFGKSFSKGTTGKPATEKRPSQVDDPAQITDDDIPF